MHTQHISDDPKLDLHLEIAHLLLIDVVGYSKLLVNEQIELLQKLNQVVRNTESFRAAEASGKLMRLPTGDGMALLFFRSPEEPVLCSLQISEGLQSHPEIRLRMGIHSGPVNQITDVNDRSNFAGAGINVAQRVMDCGDAGHILLTKHLADDLAQYRHWQPYLQDLGECEVKHGLRLHIVNLYKNGLGNPALPEKLKRRKRWSRPESSVRPVIAPRWPKFALVVAMLLSAVALAISFSIFFRRASPPNPPNPEAIDALAAVPEKSIAVLPFANLSDEKQNAFFADGVQDEILTNLAKVADLKVISRTSVMQYKSDTVRNLREIAKALRVSHVLEGTVQRAGSRVRVSAQLIDARTDTHVWADHFDRDIEDVFGIESEVAVQIVSQLKAKLSSEEKAAIEQPPTANLVAYEHYLRAKVLVRGTTFSGRRDIWFDAVDLLDEAVARAPDFFLAYYELAFVHDRIYFLGAEHTAARLALAEAAIRNMERLRPNAGETHLARAQHFYRGYLDYEHARAQLDLARPLLSNDPVIHELTGLIERRQGNWEKSTQAFERALQLDPRNLFILQQMSLTFQNLRRFEETADILDRALSVAPADVNTQVARAQVEFNWRADLRPLHRTIDAALRENPSVAREIDEAWLLLTLCERDAPAAARALAAIPPEGINENGISFPRAWCEGLVARARGDMETARASFSAARTEVEKIVREQPDYAKGLVVLGTIDAALGRKADALREGRRAIELLPVTKDALNGAYLLRYLAVIYTWTGEKDIALKQLEMAARIPGDVTYGQLRLHPYWDSLRGDARFEKIVASLAPK